MPAPPQPAKLPTASAATALPHLQLAVQRRGVRGCRGPAAPACSPPERLAAAQRQRRRAAQGVHGLRARPQEPPGLPAAQARARGGSSELQRLRQWLGQGRLAAGCSAACCGFKATPAHPALSLCSYVLFASGLPCPHIAAGANLSLPLVGRWARWRLQPPGGLSRACGRLQPMPCFQGCVGPCPSARLLRPRACARAGCCVPAAPSSSGAPREAPPTPSCTRRCWPPMCTRCCGRGTAWSSS